MAPRLAVASGGGAPNTRVQGTRSSASPPHSPLTRRPLGVTKFYRGWTLALCVIALMGASPTRVASGSLRRIFFPRVTLASSDGERIQHLEIKMSCGRFRQVAIPDDWSMEVISPVSEQTILRADAGHGSSTLQKVGDLDGAIVISVQEATCFAIHATVSSTAQSFEFDRAQLTLKP